MIKDINKFKGKHKEIFKEALQEINDKKSNVENLIFIFPIIHGISQNEYSFNNIIEAREYLNNTFLFKNVKKICESLLKISSNEIVKMLKKETLEKLKSSLTLFEYITNSEIKNILSFRNYDKKTIKKTFTDNKENKIFTQLLNHIFNGEKDYNTILLIESEMFEYSLKNITLKNIENNKLESAENLLIKYSSICPIAINNLDNKSKKNKKRDFFKSLTKEEFTIFCKFNIEKDIIKDCQKIKDKRTIKISILAILLTIPTVSIITFNILKNDQKPLLAFMGVLNSDMPCIKPQNENNENTLSEEPLIEEPSIVEEKKESNIIKYPYVEATGTGNNDLVNIALSQIGNVGGETYWRWYGFTSRVEWCACFVSWVSSQAGISTQTIPKFSRVKDGINWFINNKLFRDKTYVPRSGDLIFFNYEYSDPVHVGIVEKVENGRVYTIEGNSKNDECRRLNYPLDSSWIYGYGTPNY